VVNYSNKIKWLVLLYFGDAISLIKKYKRMEFLLITAAKTIH
jgi:hypothetical protein